MEQPRRITDSFPRRRRRRGPGRPPGRLKDKKDKDKDKVQVKVRDCPHAPSQSPPDPALLEMLRRFDLSWEYGPCTGITRLQRWERAQELGLSPPGHPLPVLPTLPADPLTLCPRSLWHEYEL
ncbi:DPOD4 polymerase, partial [Certhia brachydactyla]|nr:DPOD4 polymerase [Certhia brachydactyla]